MVPCFCFLFVAVDFSFKLGWCGGDSVSCGGGSGIRGGGGGGGDLVGLSQDETPVSVLA